MDQILFLSHRIPYPPDKGDKIRAFHVLRHLSRHFRIHLGCFFDQAHDRKYIGDLSPICATMQCLPLSRPRALINGAWSLASGKSLSQGYFHDRRMAQWVADTIAAHNPTHIYVFCSSMAPYAVPYLSGRNTVLDLVDVDSEKWRAYSEDSIWPLSQLYRAEYRATRTLEQTAVRSFGHSFFCSPEELAIFLQGDPEAAKRTKVFANGVDFDYFDPSVAHPSPFSADALPIVFVGHMDYPPNAQAARWFAQEIFPQIRARFRRAEFWAVGAGASASLQRLSMVDGVHITGRVADVRPYLAHASCAVAPLKIARGIQNKVLEAMAMARPVVATPDACTGLRANCGEDILCAENAAAFAGAVISVLESGGHELGQRGRTRVEQDYRWARQLEPLDAVMHGQRGRGGIAAHEHLMKTEAAPCNSPN